MVEVYCIGVDVARRVLLTRPALRAVTLSSASGKEGLRIFYIFIPAMQSIIDLCRELRQRETHAEKTLWHNLRNRKLSEYKFLRQYPICVDTLFGRRLYYIPDFYCHKAKLVIEADGPIHQFKKEYDKNRDEVLAALGLKILRFDNQQILNDTENVLNMITEVLIQNKKR